MLVDAHSRRRSRPPQLKQRVEYEDVPARLCQKKGQDPFVSKVGLANWRTLTISWCCVRLAAAAQAWPTRSGMRTRVVTIASVVPRCASGKHSLISAGKQPPV
jgi:hypothetical protein